MIPRERSAPAVVSVQVSTPRLTPPAEVRSLVSVGTPQARFPSSPIQSHLPIASSPTQSHLPAARLPSSPIQPQRPPSPASSRIQLVTAMPVASLPVGTPSTNNLVLEARPAAAVVARPTAVLRVLHPAKAPEVRKDADEQMWWSERVRKITASIDQKLSSVVDDNETPVIQPRDLEVELHVTPTRIGPRHCDTVRAAAFDHQESSALQSRSASVDRTGGMTDDEIPSALASLKTMRQEIENDARNLREKSPERGVVEAAWRSPCRAPTPVSTHHVEFEPPPIMHPVNLVSQKPPQRPVAKAPMMSADTETHPITDACGDDARSPRMPNTSISSPQQNPTSSPHEQSPAFSPREPNQSLWLRQDKQELRIQALHAKLRHLEIQVSAEQPPASRQTPREVASRTSPLTGVGMDLENELGTFKQELKAQHMEHNLSMVQEANVLRQDVTQALRNERESRNTEVAELRSGIETVHERLMQELHETMDLVGSRLEQRLQDVVHPDRLHEMLSGRLEMQRLTGVLQKGKELQQGSPTGDLQTISKEDVVKEIDIEREARCRSIIDLRLEMEHKMIESVGRTDQQCGLFAEELAALQEMVEKMVKAGNRVGQADGAPSLQPGTGDDDTVAIFSISHGLEEERQARKQEVQELARRIDAISSADQESQISTQLEALSRNFEEEQQTRNVPPTISGANQEPQTKTRLEALSHDFEEERRIRSADFQQLLCHFEDLERWMRNMEQDREAQRASIQDIQFRVGHQSMARTGANSSEVNSSEAKAILKSFANQLDEEREARSSVIQELHIRLGRELADMRERDEKQSAALTQAITCEREARASETCELRSLLESKLALSPDLQQAVAGIEEARRLSRSNSRQTV